MAHEAQLKSAFKKGCNCYEFDSVFEEISPALKDSDFAIGNLETTLPGKNFKPTGFPSFGSPDSFANSLKNAGLNLLVTANNHCLDKGKSGLENTIRTLDNENIYHTGTYGKTSEFKNTTSDLLILEKNNIRFAVLSYTQFVNAGSIPKGVEVKFINKKKIKKDIEAAKQSQPDFIIIYLHFGNEYERVPNDYQKEIVEFSFSQGADIVLGSHPHVLQKFELRKKIHPGGRIQHNLVNYSLGNFISGQFYKHTTGGILFHFTLKKMVGRKGKKDLTIENISYSPIWVYRDTGKNPESFHILPIEKYLKNKGKYILNEKSKTEMNDFYRETVIHLGKFDLNKNIF